MFNLVVLTGRLTADPELRYTANNTPVTSFSIAVSRRYKAGEEAQADFINIVAWRQTAEFVTKYFQKGSMIGIRKQAKTVLLLKLLPIMFSSLKQSVTRLHPHPRRLQASRMSAQTILPTSRARPMTICRFNDF